MRRPHARTRAVWAALTVNPRLTIHELMRLCGLPSTASVHRCLRDLVRTGAIAREPYKARATAVLVPLWEARAERREAAAWREGSSNV